MNPQRILFGFFICMCILFDGAKSQGTGKVQDFFKKYFGEYYPKTTRSYTLYGNGLNGPADFHAGLPVNEDSEGPIKSIIIRRASASPKPSQGAPAVPKMNSPYVPMSENAWQPTNFDPVEFARGGHRGRSDLTEEFDDTESRIITAADAEHLVGDGSGEFRIESSMSFSSPGIVSNSEK